MTRWKKRTEGSAAQIGQPFMEEPRQQHSYARTKGSGAAQTPRSRSVESMKTKSPGYMISFKTSKGNRKLLKENTTGAWKIIIFSSRKEAQEQIDGMSPDSKKTMAFKIHDLKHGMIPKKDQELRDAQLKRYAINKKSENMKIAATQDYVAGKITRATYRNKMRAADGLSGKRHLNTEAYGKYVANSLHDGHGNKSNIVTVNKPAHQIELKLTTVKTQELEPTQRSPDVEKRSQYFVDAIKRGQTIPPILVHRLPDGSYQIIDGHARVRAYQKMGIEKVPAVENGLTDVLASAGRKIGGAAKKAAVEGARAVGEMRGAYAAGKKSQKKKPKRKSRFFEQKDEDEEEY